MSKDGVKIKGALFGLLKVDERRIDSQLGRRLGVEAGREITVAKSGFMPSLIRFLGGDPGTETLVVKPGQVGQYADRIQGSARIVGVNGSGEVVAHAEKRTDRVAIAQRAAPGAAAGAAVTSTAVASGAKSDRPRLEEQDRRPEFASAAKGDGGSTSISDNADTAPATRTQRNAGEDAEPTPKAA